MVSGFFTSPWDQSRIFWGAASLIRIASNVMGFACRSRMPQRSLVGLSSLIRLPKGRSVSIRYSPLSSGSLLAVLRHQLDVERETLELLHEHVERLWGAGLEEVFSLDDRLVDTVTTLHVVRLDRQHLLQRVRRAVSLERPHLHLAEPLPAELGLAAERLLGHQRVRADRAGVHLVVHEVGQLEDVDLADRHFLVEPPARAPIVEDGLARGRQARLLQVLLDLFLGR